MSSVCHSLAFSTRTFGSAQRFWRGMVGEVIKGRRESEVDDAKRFRLSSDSPSANWIIVCASPHLQKGPLKSSILPLFVLVCDKYRSSMPADGRLGHTIVCVYSNAPQNFWPSCLKSFPSASFLCHGKNFCCPSFVKFVICWTFISKSRFGCGFKCLGVEKVLVLDHWLWVSLAYVPWKRVGFPCWAELSSKWNWMPIPRSSTQLWEL